MTVDLLVVNYNTKALLERFLDTLHKDYEPDIWKLYITDNGSDDGSRQWLHENRGRYYIDYTFLGENVGYSAAINHMSSISDSEYLCAVNADTYFTTAQVKAITDSMDSYPLCGVMGPKQLDEHNNVRHGGIFWNGTRTMNPVHRGWAQLDEDDSLFKDVVDCWTVSGSIYYVRRTAWNDCTNYPPYRELYPNVEGALLPTPHYFEETFCSQLMHHLNWKVMYNGEGEAHRHTWHASSSVQTDNFFHQSQPIYVAACEALGIVHECH